MTSASPSRRENAQTPARLTRVERIIVLSGSIMFAVLAVSFMLGLWTLRQDYLAQEHDNLRRLTLTLSEQTSRALEEVDLLIQETVPQLAPEILAAKDDRLHRLLRNRIAGRPQVQALLAFGADGKMLGHSRVYPAPAVNVADRDYFLAQTKGGKGLFISAPHQNRVDGRWMISLSRRVDDPDGALAGVAMAAVSMDYFNRIYTALNLPEGVRIELCRDDGAVLAAYPFAESKLGAASCGAMAHPKDISVQGAVGEYPLTVWLIEPQRTVLRHWWKTVLPLGLGMLAAAAGVGLALNKAWSAEQLGKKQKENERLREDIERITRHDLKAPLTSMYQGCNLLLDDQDDAAARIDTLGKMRDTAKRALNLIDAYFTISNMEHKKFQLRPVPVDLVQAVNQAWRELAPAAAVKNMRLELSLDGGPCPAEARRIVPAEGPLILAMLANLMRNAIEASPPEEAVEAAIASQKGRTLISIGNVGAVPAEIRAHFFEKYVTAGKRGGTGLGTYAAKLIAESHGGDISLDTSVENRTVVTVSLPSA